MNQNQTGFFFSHFKKIEWIEGENHDVFEAVNP